MTHTQAVLRLQYADVSGRETQLEAALRRIPGVELVQPTRSEGALEVPVQIVFDPAQTNPVAIKAALSDEGFTVLSANEEGTVA